MSNGRDIPPKFKRDFLVIGHSIDNREVWIEPDQIVACQIGSRIIDNIDKTWSHHVTFTLWNGVEIKDELTDKGMERLAEMLDVEGWSLDPEGD